MTAAEHRTGQPSPLVFHLSAALASYTQALLAAPRADSDGFPWRGEVADAARALGPDLDQFEIASEISRRLTGTLEGLELWQRHPYRREMTLPPVLWQQGSSRIIDYGRCPEASDPAGPPVLVVPSLINKSYILDLAPGRSLLRWLASEGFRPLLLDWGVPGPAEAGYSLGNYGAERFLPGLEEVNRLAGTRPAVLGYCMGGTLSVGMAARRPDLTGSLAVMGAPWDFSSEQGIPGGLRALIRSRGPESVENMLDGMGEAFGLVPVPFFQMLFAMVNPIQAALKFRRLAAMDPDSARAQLFVALEDWLADGVPMAAPAAKELLADWHIRNLTALGRWRFLGGPVDPADISAPVLCISGQADSIAPPQMSEPVVRGLAGARLLRPGTGHVGMVVGSAARASVWRPLGGFLAGQRG